MGTKWPARQPAGMRLADGVYALEQTVAHGDREVTINPAAVETDRGILLLDVGYPRELDQLANGLADIGHGLSDVWGVLVTHQDGDHAGALADLADRVGPVVFAHEETAPYVDGRKDPIKSDGERYPAVDVHVELQDGVRFRTRAGPMEVVFTPGHAPGHVSAVFPDENLLVAADALTAPAGELAGPSEQFTLDMPEALESLGRFADYGIDRTLCYHGGLVEEGSDAIARIASESAEE